MTCLTGASSRGTITGSMGWSSRRLYSRVNSGTVALAGRPIAIARRWKLAWTFVTTGIFEPRTLRKITTG